ncbi:hypothetical protein SNE40_009081 [Patella caerulea]|uniref:Gamma-glutamylcyclotransferase family protein n=1 Tax=Patella caerulea TaxID=87958 RepID=A0AAN8JUA4_PATCE
MTSQGRFLIFVYGTLKRGQPNEAQFANSNGLALFKGSGKTKEKYPLVIASQYNIPFLLFKPGTGQNIEGEVMEVDSKMLSHCDEFEGHPDLYERLETEITLVTNEKNEALPQPQNLTCWCYFLKKYQPKLLELPYLESYKSLPELPYVQRYERDSKNGHLYKDDVYQK